MSSAEHPHVSVVIPARNAGNTLTETLDSLLAQSDSGWEALIVDDGSTDETADIIRRYANRDNRFVGLHGSGSGASGARNIGLARATGHRVLFLDSDDWIDASLPRAHERGTGCRARRCCGLLRLSAASCRMVSRRRWVAEPRIAQAPFETFARSCLVAIHAVLIEREIVVRVGGFDTALRTCEDWDLWQRVARLGERWIHVDAALSYYRTNEHSLSGDVEPVLSRWCHRDPDEALRQMTA